MDFFIVIDGADEIGPVVERAVASAGVSVVRAASVAAAKRKLVEAAPLMLISRASFAEDLDGGYRLGRELQSHASLSTIPLVLVDADLNDESLRKATECGAKALIPWPVSAESLAIRLAALVPGVKFGEVLAAPVKPVEPPQPAASAVTAGQAAVAARPVVQSEKLQLAQQLLARVLHSLRTSDLLEVADLEDVPAIVFQMTRTVCGMNDESRAAPKSATTAQTVMPAGVVPTGAATPGSAPKASGDITADLEQAFRLKK